jgi:hypothetical protein
VDFDWKQQCKDNTEQEMLRIVNLIRDYQEDLTNESDPRNIAKCKKSISELKQKLEDHEIDLKSHSHGQGKKQLALDMANITHEDLNFVITAFLRQRIPNVDDQNNFPPTKPEEKMSKNGLTSTIKILLDVGLPKANEVRHLIENNAKINFPDVPERLKSSFKIEYLKLVKEGIKGDDLFNSLHKFASCNNTEPRWQLAGLAVLCYFFETCDVFER